MTPSPEDAARMLARHLSSRGETVLASAVPTAHGLLAIVLKDPGGWTFGDLRVSDVGEPFAPPIGAFDDETRTRLRRQSTHWFNASGFLPGPDSVVRLDAFGLLLVAGRQARWKHVRDAY